MLEQFAEDFHSIAQLGKLVGSESLKLRGEVGDAHLASLVQQARAFRSGHDPQAARVFGIFGDLDQAAARQAGDDAAHGRRLDLLGGGQFL